MTLPKNSTAHLQPKDAGIIKNFKILYRKKLIVDYMASLERKKEFSVDLKKDVLIISDAWINVKQAKIENCFKKTGIIKAFEKVINDENKIDKNPIIWPYTKDLADIKKEENDAETENIPDEDELVALFENDYQIENSILGAENGKGDGPEFKPSDLLESINTILGTKITSNRFSEILTNETVKNLNELKIEVEKFIPSKTR